MTTQTVHHCSDCGFGFYAFNSAAQVFGRELIQRHIALLEFKLFTRRGPCPSCRNPLFYTKPWASYPSKEAYGVLSPVPVGCPSELRARELGFCIQCHDFAIDAATLKIAKVDHAPKEEDFSWVEVQELDFHDRLFGELKPFAIEGIPEGRHPVQLTWLLAAASLVGVLLLDRFGQAWSFESRHPFKHFGLNFITSLFLHDGGGHFFGNMIFLFLFAYRLEPHLGAEKLATLFFVSGVAGNLAYSLVYSGSFHLVGASGAIAGIMAYLVLEFPDARWRQSLGNIGRSWYSTYRVVLHLPLIPLGFFWLIFQAYMEIHHGRSGIGYLAHFAGAMGGIGYWMATRNES